MSRSLLISAAEISGDVFGASLARELCALDPDLALFGLGGPRMAASGVDIVADITDTSIVGFFDGLRHAPRYLRANGAIRRALADRSPAAVIAVDAPGFNFALLRAARDRGIATIYYVCPQTWLWNPDGATARLRAAAGHAVAVLPEEAALYRRAGLATIHHGHPLVDMVGPPHRVEPAGRLDSADSAVPIGLLPGSRHHEIGRLLPVMCDAMNIVAASMGPIHVRMGLASERQADAVERARGRLGPCVRLTRTCAAEALTSSLVSLAASGSVLLEACLLDAPVVMTYRLDRATHWIGYHFLRIHEKLPHYALPNLIARERIIPEIVEREAVPERLAAEVCRIARDAGARRRMREGYRQVREALGSPGVTRAVARDILDIV